MSLAASEGDWHPTLTNPSSTPSGRVQDEAEVMSSVLTRGYVVPEASEISRDVCFPATQDPFDIGSGSCAPTGGTPEAEIEGKTSTPSATFSREGTLTGRPQGEQHRARTFTATALIGRYGTAPALSPKPDPFGAWRPLTHRVFRFFPGVLAADRTLHWTVPGKPDLTPWRGVGSYTHDSCYHSQTDNVSARQKEIRAGSGGGDRHQSAALWSFCEQEPRQWLQGPPGEAAAGDKLCCVIEEINPRVNYKPGSLGCQWADCRV
ncbi:hypothetical protein E1301_Tti013840 [Triplophysa tibetana]|uniref:Uncharacterized protein n=1 Tax=Triplophysa tibetana TaxID=1572043 RepID=A0A5A9P949_9TELE|nr:hypothetical protein E1301_Tti013840 [Triplophysa tibetana]